MWAGQPSTGAGPTADPTPSVAFPAGWESLAGFYSHLLQPRGKGEAAREASRGTVLPREELTAHRYIWHWELDVPLLPLVICCHLCTMPAPGDSD